MSGEAVQPDASRNLLGVGCPMNMVYAKVELAKLKTGQVFELILDNGAPVTNVSESIRREGHEILSRHELTGGGWSVVIRKG